MAASTLVPSLPPILAAGRLEQVRYAIRDVAVLAEEVARQGHEILPLNIGDPLQFDFATPPALIEAVAKAMRDGHSGYAPSTGIPEALEAVHGEAHRKGIRNVQSVFITQGVSEAVDLCLAALVNPGENVLTPRPEYPLYWAVLAKLGAELNTYALDEGSGWEPDLDDMARRVNSRTRAIVVINPNNPTGSLYSRRTLEAVAELAREHNLVVFADEIYDKLTLEGEHVSLAGLAPDVPVITFGGLSKAYLAPGWRVGWGIASGDAGMLRPYLEGIHKLLRSRLSANHPEQYAIRPALEGPQDHLPEVLGKLRARRDLTVGFANSTPRLSCVAPQGAFYAFPRLDISGDDEEFVHGLLREKHVLLVHGSGFGQAAGTRHFRIVFLPDDAILRRAYRAISAYLREHYA
ncbi:MAG TPA: aminotransferase class I/II-fold pyridoxal phosphate-dependent enzyme [Terriglobia bacterium]|nr:aminotransferase class I/II-fold pyridoxal phosphate-dependent enzyme [Terriglobia bacterium]